MAYVGFDLDETLGRFSVAHFAGVFLQPKTAIYESAISGNYGTQKIPPPIPYSEQLEKKCDYAFQLFVDCLVEKERQTPALGLVRPSMIDFIHRLYELKEVGAVKNVLIYSNNGNPALLKLAAKMLEKLAGAPGLFCDFIHWFHPLRSAEITYGRPGNARKSLAVLLKGLNNSSCNPEALPIDKDDVYFFDDSIPPHYDLLNSLGDRYIQLKPYNFDANPNVILECFQQAFETAGLVDDEEYFRYVAPVMGSTKNYAEILQTMHNDIATFKLKKSIPNDTKLRIQFNTMFPRRVAKTNFTRSLAAFRKLENKLNKGMILSNQEQTNYEKAKSTISNFERVNPNQLGGKKKYRKTKRRRRHT
jgi:hypothetical protein